MSARIGDGAGDEATCGELEVDPGGGGSGGDDDGCTGGDRAVADTRDVVVELDDIALETPGAAVVRPAVKVFSER